MKQLCGEGKKYKALHDTVDPFLKVKVIRNVKLEDVWKFEFVEGGESGR